MKKKFISMMVLLMVVSIFSGCRKPYKKEMIVEIKPNQTAFVVPLEGATKKNQGAFMSLDYLESNKVATKRISLPQRFLQHGRRGWQGRYIPTAKVIMMDRTPITREWTAETATGTSKKNQAIWVESKDSIGFAVGVSITALIAEENAAAFLYNYAGIPLGRAVDQNVRGFVTSVLSREFGARNLQECKTDKKTISEMLLSETKKEFEKMGITINNIGLVGGLAYEDKEIQDAINKAYMAEMKVEQAKQEKLEQDEINKKKIAIATAERQAAEEFAKAQDAMISKIKLEIEQIKAQAELEKAKKWDGKLPSKIMPEGSGFILNDTE